MQLFIIQIPGEYTIAQAGALAAKLEEAGVEIRLEDASASRPAPRTKTRKSSGVQWSNDPILYAQQKNAVLSVIEAMAPGKPYAAAQIEKILQSKQTHYETATPVLYLAQQAGWMVKTARGVYEVTGKGRDDCRPSIRIAD